MEWNAKPNRLFTAIHYFRSSKLLYKKFFYSGHFHFHYSSSFSLVHENDFAFTRNKYCFFSMSKRQLRIQMKILFMRLSSHISTTQNTLRKVPFCAEPKVSFV